MELRGPTADVGKRGTAPDHGTEPAEEVIILAVCEARSNDCRLPEDLANGVLSFSLCLVGNRRRCRAGPEGRYVDQACHGMALCCHRYSARTFDVNGPVGLCGCLGQDAH